MPDPPPANVGEIEPNIDGENLTVRQRLKQHQEIESCAACHRGIDPYGLALENFDVLGAWRTKQNGEDFRGGRPSANRAFSEGAQGFSYIGFRVVKKTP